MCGAVDSERHCRFRQDSLSSHTTFMSTDDKSVDTCHNGVNPHFVLGYFHYVTDQLQKISPAAGLSFHYITNIFSLMVPCLVILYGLTPIG